MDNIYYQIKLGNTIAYSKTKQNATEFQNQIYNKTQMVAKIKPMKKSQIPIGDWELVIELTHSDLSVRLR